MNVILLTDPSEKLVYSIVAYISTHQTKESLSVEGLPSANKLGGGRGGS